MFHGGQPRHGGAIIFSSLRHDFDVLIRQGLQPLAEFALQADGTGGGTLLEGVGGKNPFFSSLPIARG